MTFFVSFLLVLTALAARPAAAQAPESDEQSSIPLLTETDQRIAVARAFLRQSNPEAAAQMLEALYEANPGDLNVANLLRNCYQQLKRYPKMELLDRRLTERYPNVFGYRLDLAEVLAEQGQLDSARAAYRAAIGLLPPSDQNTMLMLLQSQIRHGLSDDALLLIDSVREAHGNASLFGVERGSVLESQKKYRSAASEYLPLIAEDTTREAMEGERRLLAMLQFEDSSPEVEKLLLDHTKTGGTPRAVKLLAEFYIRAGRFDRALEYCLRRDTLEGLTASSPGYFMRQCSDRKLYAQVVMMGEHLSLRKDNNSLVGDAAFLYANALVQVGRLDEGMARYDTIVAASPNPGEKADALYSLGMIYYDQISDYPRALSYFDSVVTRFPRGLSYLSAQRTIPYCYLRMGDIEAAEKNFRLLASQPFNQDIDEEIAYNLGAIKFYRREFDSSRVMLKKLMITYPQGFYVNDALQLLLVLEDAGSSPDLLSAYADALWYQERRMPDSCHDQLERLVNNDDKTLADDALYRMVQLDIKHGDTARVLGEIEKLAAGFPESYYVPFGLKLKADILAVSPATIDAAKDLYRQVLEKYPNYPFCSEVRKKLRQLETDLKVG